MTWRAWMYLCRSLLVAAVLLCAPLALAQDAADGPAAPVGRLNQTLLETMQAADELGYAGRFDKLEPVLREVFDFPFMARAAVGRTWQELEPAQRKELTRLFARMSVSTFAARFDGYSGETFEILGQRAGPRDTVLVESQIVRPNDPPVGLNYLMRESGAGWSAIDVFLDSKFSELARQRAEFTAVLKRGGYQELVENLEQRIEELAADG